MADHPKGKDYVDSINSEIELRFRSRATYQFTTVVEMPEGKYEVDSFWNLQSDPSSFFIWPDQAAQPPSQLFIVPCKAAKDSKDAVIVAHQAPNKFDRYQRGS